MDNSTLAQDLLSTASTEPKKSAADRILTTLIKRRERALNGEINCIPFHLPRLSSKLPGIEKDNYILISGSTKSGKSQIANYLYVYTPILYAYYHPDKVRVKIFYFPLEETQESIMLRFISFLLYTLSNIRISPLDLKSTNSNNILPDRVLNALQSEQYRRILSFFEENVLFLDDRNPTGIYKALTRYAEKTGAVHNKEITIINKESGYTEKRQAFDYYEPYDKDEYVIVLTDHVSLLDSERGYSLRESICKFSEYMILLRNRYHYIPVVVHQQSMETSSLDAFKANKIRPTVAGLSDSKYTARDCSVMLGITNPYAYEIPVYEKYNIQDFKSNIRFLEVVLNRNGESNVLIPLFFDGAVNFFKEMPRFNDTEGLKKTLYFINTTIRQTPNAGENIFKPIN